MFKKLRWLAINSAAFLCCYLGFSIGLAWAVNVVLAWTWFCIVIAAIADVAFVIDSDRIKDRIESASVPVSLDYATSVAFALVIAANGHIATAVLFAFVETVALSAVISYKNSNNPEE